MNQTRMLSYRRLSKWN